MTYKNVSSLVSARAIEETYTDNDITNVPDTPSIGIAFNFPIRWLSDRSEFKAIGIRRLKVIPSSHVAALNILIGYYSPRVANDGNYDEDATITGGNRKKIECNITYPLSIIPENSVEEIIHNMVNTINSALDATIEFPKDSSNVNDQLPEDHIAHTRKMSSYIYITYSFDYKTGNLKLIVHNNLNGTADVDQYLSIKNGSSNPANEDVTDIDAFLQFLNQPTAEVKDLEVLTNETAIKEFNGVWDRANLQFHASFSDNNRGFIGLNNDFYEKPSLFFDPPTNEYTFYIRFTTDGIHYIIPRYCRMYLGLCFIRNYKNSLVTK